MLTREVLTLLENNFLVYAYFANSPTRRDSALNVDAGTA